MYLSTFVTRPILRFAFIVAFLCTGCGKPEVKPLSSATPDPNGPLMPVLGSRSEVETIANGKKQHQHSINEVEK